MKKYDVIISGGGMIGSIAAVALSQKDLSVLLIEANKPAVIDESKPRDLRVSAISADNINFLKTLGIFNKLIPSRIQAYDKMQVWDNRSSGEIEFTADYSKQDYLGYLLENINLIQAAWKTVAANCDTLAQTQIKTLENDGAQIRVELTTGETFKSRLLVAAEGRKSRIRDLAEIKTKEKSYHQHGLVAYLSIDKAPTKTALQAFNQGGPIGILPIDAKENIFSIVWSLADDKVDEFLNCNEAQFEQAISQAIGKDFGRIKLTSKRAAFPLSQLYAQKYFNNRIVLCGDTAHGVHPLAGQGVNLGIGDIQQLVDTIDSQLLKDDELLHRALKKYQRRRLSKVQETSEMMSFLHHLFKDDNHIKKPVRNFGMNILNKLPIKQWLMQQAGSR